MKIRIYLDGTFESLSAAKTLTPVEKRAKIKALQADLKTIKKVEALRVTREAAKKAGNKVKDKELLAKIKALKATLSSNRNSSSEIVSKFIRAVMDQPTGAAQTGPDRAPLTAAERAARDAKPAAKTRGKSKDEKALDRVDAAENALIKYREGKSVHDKIRPGDKVAKAEMREMEQLMADLPEAKANYRKMPKSAPMQKSRDNAKKMIDAMEKRLDMLKKKYIG